MYERPIFDPISERIRDIWIIEFRRFMRIKTGKPSAYSGSPRWDGVSKKGGPKYKPIWPKIAALLQKENLRPDIYVRAFFVERVGLPPTPNMLLSAEAKARYFKYLDYFDRGKAEEFEIQANSFSSALKQAVKLFGSNALRMVLFDRRTMISPLFRYAIALKHNLVDDAKYWKSEATTQYLGDPTGYSKVWKDFLPPMSTGEEANV